MFNECGNGYSLADIAAATNGNGGFGGDNGAWWIIILFLFAFCGWGNNGYGAGLFGGGAGSTGSGITDGYILTSDFANIERKIDGVNNGLCDGFYAMNTGMLNGFGNVGTQLSNLGAQITQCCCDNRYETATQFAQLNYNLADQSCQTRRVVEDATRDLMANQDANTRAILDFMTQDKIADLQAENAALKAAANNAAQTWDIVNQLRPCPTPAYVVPNPYCNCGTTCGTY